MPEAAKHIGNVAGDAVVCGDPLESISEAVNQNGGFAGEAVAYGDPLEDVLDTVKQKGKYTGDAALFGDPRTPEAATQNGVLHVVRLVMVALLSMCLKP